MSKLPVCSGQDAVRAFQKLGYAVDHQTGSHVILRHGNLRRLTIPNHRELAKGHLARSDSRSGHHQGTICGIALA